MTSYGNKQWIVTAEGIEAPREGGYWIGTLQLRQTTERDGVTYYDFPIHVAEKEWVDIFYFIEAFVYALRADARMSGEAIDETMLSRTIRRATAVARQIH